jgi:hypothetical protein
VEGRSGKGEGGRGNRRGMGREKGDKGWGKGDFQIIK